MKEITSRQNEEIKALSKLKNKKYRELEQKFIAEGVRTCQTLSESILLENIYCTQKMLVQAKKIVSQDKIILVTPEIMEKISSAKSPSGLLGVFSIPEVPEPSRLGPGIVLAGITDPGNMGTIIRTCAATGFTSVVTVGGADPWSPKVVQSSAGTIAHITLFEWSWEQLLKHKKKLKLIALVAAGGSRPDQVDLQDSLLVLGSEAHGIGQKWIDTCDEQLTLPMSGTTESLNAAVAGSIALYLASQ